MCRLLTIATFKNMTEIQPAVFSKQIIGFCSSNTWTASPSKIWFQMRTDYTRFFFVLDLTSLSTQFRMVPACNRRYNNHFIVMSHWNITPSRHSCMISCPVTMFWQRVNQFLRWTTIYMASIWQWSFNYQFEIVGLTRPRIEPGPLGHGATALPLGQ